MRNIFLGAVICGCERIWLFWLLVISTSWAIFLYILRGIIGRNMINLTQTINILYKSPRIFNSTLCLVFFTSQSLYFKVLWDSKWPQATVSFIKTIIPRPTVQCSRERQWWLKPLRYSLVSGKMNSGRKRLSQITSWPTSRPQSEEELSSLCHSSYAISVTLVTMYFCPWLSQGPDLSSLWSSSSSLLCIQSSNEGCKRLLSEYQIQYPRIFYENFYQSFGQKKSTGHFIYTLFLQIAKHRTE